MRKACISLCFATAVTGVTGSYALADSSNEHVSERDLPDSRKFLRFQTTGRGEFRVKLNSSGTQLSQTPPAERVA
jgi:hypothetical protein